MSTNLPFLGAEAMHVPGQERVIECDCADETHGVVFEDDGDTGYFYARDHGQESQPFVDALHVYNVPDMEAGVPVQVKILWSRYYQAAALLVNRAPKAIFHFGERCGYARDPFPEPDVTTGWTHAPIHAGLIGLFFHRNSGPNLWNLG